jgi:hypothetical protein
MDASLLKPLQKKVAVSAVPPSAMRRQGLPGLLAEIRTFCAEFPLDPSVESTAENFSQVLDRATKQLEAKGVLFGCQWGTARKALNLFLRDATYNHYLQEFYRLYTIEELLELPLDGEVASRLVREAGGDSLPAWPGVYSLSAMVSREYQAFATRVASHRNVARVHLDLEYWPAFSLAAV